MEERYVFDIIFFKKFFTDNLQNLQTVCSDAAIPWYIRSNIHFVGRNFFDGFSSIAWFSSLFWWNAYRTVVRKYYRNSVGMYWLAHWPKNNGELSTITRVICCCSFM
jgi:hypothetical protein